MLFPGAIIVIMCSVIVMMCSVIVMMCSVIVVEGDQVFYSPFTGLVSLLSGL